MGSRPCGVEPPSDLLDRSGCKDTQAEPTFTARQRGCAKVCQGHRIDRSAMVVNTLLSASGRRRTGSRAADQAAPGPLPSVRSRVWAVLPSAVLTGAPFCFEMPLEAVRTKDADAFVVLLQKVRGSQLRQDPWGSTGTGVVAAERSGDPKQGSP